MGLPSSSTGQAPLDSSAELKKLLAAATTSSSAQASAYDAETMVDELLTSRWEPMDPRLATRTSRASFAHQTSFLHSLQSVLSDTIDHLIVHRQTVANRITELEHDSRRVSRKFPSRLETPDLLLQSICGQLEDLEDRFTKVSATAVTMGDQLSTLETERLHALETEEVMDTLMALSDPCCTVTKSSPTLLCRLHNPNDLHEASRIIKRLAMFSSEVSSPTIALAVTEIERLCQVIETTLLTEFGLEQERGNVAGMAKCATSLIEYNDKEKVTDRYVWNVMCTRLASAAGEPTVSSLDPLEDLDALCTNVYAICTEQFAVIDKVFPAIARSSVRELLVERLVNDPVVGILSLLDRMLTRRWATDPSRPLAADVSEAISGTDSYIPSSKRDYVIRLCSAYKRTCTMVADIDAIDRQDRLESLGHTAANEYPRIRPFLRLQLHSLFSTHRERYAQVEMGLLQDQFNALLATVHFQSPGPSKSTGSGSKSKSAATPSPSPSTSSTHLVPSASSTSMPSSSNVEKYSGMYPSDSSLALVERVTQLANDAVLESRFEEVVHEAIDRCVSVLERSELRGELLTKIFTSFVASFGDEYLAKLLKLSIEVLHEQRLALNSPLQFFLVTEAVLKRIDFLDGQFEALSQSLQDFPTQLTICQECHTKCLNNLERKLAFGLQQVLTVVEKLISQILTANQGKSDFLDGPTSMSLSSSKACQKCTEFLRPLVTAACRFLVGENGTRFLIALARSFKELYLQHLRTFRFDPDGACMLLCDVSEYRDAFRTSSMPAAVDDIFDLLHEVANIFALPVDNVGGFIREGKLAMLDQQTLHRIVKRRWDYKVNAEKLSASLKGAKNTKSEKVA